MSNGLTFEMLNGISIAPGDAIVSPGATVCPTVEDGPK